MINLKNVELDTFYSFSFRRTLFFSDTFLYFKSQYYFFVVRYTVTTKSCEYSEKSQGPSKEAENIRSVFGDIFHPKRMKQRRLSVYLQYCTVFVCLAYVVLIIGTFPLKGLVSRAGLGFWWHKWIDLGLNKRRAWFIFYFFLESKETWTKFTPLTLLSQRKLKLTARSTLFAL